MRMWIDGDVKAGKFANASDYIRDLVRRHQSEQEAISLALKEGGRACLTGLNVYKLIKKMIKSCIVKLAKRIKKAAFSNVMRLSEPG